MNPMVLRNGLHDILHQKGHSQHSKHCCLLLPAQCLRYNSKQDLVISWGVRFSHGEIKVLHSPHHNLSKPLPLRIIYWILLSLITVYLHHLCFNHPLSSITSLFLAYSLWHPNLKNPLTSLRPTISSYFPL